jgi:uncharacterized protein
VTLSVHRLLASLAVCLVANAAANAAAPPQPKYPSLRSETPAHFTPDHSSFGYAIRDVMIPMRDGVKLHTVIMIPKGAHDAPMLLTRTPYDASSMVMETEYGQLSGNMGTALEGYDNAVPVIVDGGYIRVIQDVRGKYGSEGDFVMNRPFRGPLNHTPVDESTDTYDTIDWLVKHVGESNGKVGILGISYDGYEPLTALINPNPALKVVVPMNPMVDGWMGDDWFHHGAFRELNLPYIHTSRKRLATTKPSGGATTTTITTSTCITARPAPWARPMAWGRSASGTRWSHTRRMTRSGASRRWTGSSRNSSSKCR